MKRRKRNTKALEAQFNTAPVQEMGRAGKEKNYWQILLSQRWSDHVESEQNPRLKITKACREASSDSETTFTSYKDQCKAFGSIMKYLISSKYFASHLNGTKPNDCFVNSYLFKDPYRKIVL